VIIMPYEYKGNYRVDTLSSGRPAWIPPNEKVIDTASQMMQTFSASLCGNTITESNIEMAVRVITAYLLSEEEIKAIFNKESINAALQEELEQMADDFGTPEVKRKIAYNRAWTSHLLPRAMRKINKYADGIEAQVCVVRKKSHDHKGNEINIMLPVEVDSFLAEVSGDVDKENES
jgi:hypothetical protein